MGERGARLLFRRRWPPAASIAEIVRDLEADLADVSDRHRLDSIATIVAEVRGNLRHAGPNGGTLHVTLWQGEDGLTALLIDDTAAFDPTTRPDRRPTDAPPTDLSDSGRGLQIVAALSAAIRYRRLHGCNVLKVRIASP